MMTPIAAQAPPQHGLPFNRPRSNLPRHLLTLAAFGPLMVGATWAQDSSYMYLGIGGGNTTGHVDEQRMADAVVVPLANGFSSATLTTDRDVSGYKAFLGYQVNRNLGFELGYVNLGKQSFNYVTVPNGNLAAEVRNQGVLVDLVGTLPITTNFSALARVGAAYSRTRTTFVGTGAVSVTNPQPSERGFNPKVGLGLQYAFSDSFSLRGEAERYRINDAVGGHGRVNLYSVSLVFPFGRRAAPMAKVAYSAPPPAPVVAPYVAPVPEPMPAPMAQVQQAPLVQPLPLPQAARRVTYSAESMFGFDASAVQPEGKVALDAFTGELAGTQYEKITVEGHTDRLGSTAYNQTLSLQRAEAVKDYLVRSGQLDAGKINTVGLSESTPVTKPEDCKGQTQNAALITCLQPDRRVEIEVSGTR